jgi:hypothetical protein
MLGVWFGSKHYEAMHLWKCIVGCIFNSAGLIITREIPFMYGQ